MKDLIKNAVQTALAKDAVSKGVSRRKFVEPIKADKRASVSTARQAKRDMISAAKPEGRSAVKTAKQVGRDFVAFAKESGRAAVNNAKGLYDSVKPPIKMFKKGGSAMSDKTGRALGRKTADAKGRAIKKGK